MRPRLTDIGFTAHQNTYGENGKPIKFSKFKMGNGALPSNYRALTDLLNPVVNVPLTDFDIEDDYVLLQGTFNNAELSESFYWKEVGIYIFEPEDINPQTGEPIQNAREYLYAYGHVDLEEDEAAANIPKYNKETYEIKLTYRIYFGESTDLATAYISASAAVTRGDFEAHIYNYNNPHKVTKAQVGLGNVPNVTTDNQTPTISEAKTLAKLINGENLRTIMGKIAKAIGELMNHITNTTVHITAAERTAWNNKAAGSHTHSASQITSGKFDFARGGTNCDSEQAFRSMILGWVSGGGVTHASMTMLASGWTDNTYSFESNYASSSYHIEISLSPTATGEEYRAFVSAKMTGSGTSNVVTALGTVPTINIPVYLTVMNA